MNIESNRMNELISKKGENINEKILLFEKCPPQKQNKTHTLAML